MNLGEDDGRAELFLQDRRIVHFLFEEGLRFLDRAEAQQRFGGVEVSKHRSQGRIAVLEQCLEWFSVRVDLLGVFVGGRRREEALELLQLLRSFGVAAEFRQAEILKEREVARINQRLSLV